MNTVGEPCAGESHARFDEGRLGRPRLNQPPTLLGLAGAVVEGAREEPETGALVVTVRLGWRDRDRCGLCRRRCPGFDRAGGLPPGAAGALHHGGRAGDGALRGSG